MDPIKAASLGVDPDEVRITSESNRYRGHWIVWVPDTERSKRILTQSRDIFEMCRWKAQLRRVVYGS